MAYCAHCGSYVAQVSFAPCASCANPTNGAPPTLQRAGTNATGLVIGIAAAAFAVIAFIGILAAIAVPNLLASMQRAKQKRTIADMRIAAAAIEQYLHDHPQLPSGHYVAQLAGELEPTYVKTLPSLDGWGVALRYLPAEDGYAVISAGANGTFEHEAAADYEGGATEHFDCDIVFAGGAFVQYPRNVSPGGAQ